MKLSKKGVGVGQVFLFIIAAITFSLIMIFGYKVISDVITTGDDVIFTQFKTDLESDVQRIYTEYDSVRKVSYRVPGEFEQICFVDFEFDASPDILQQQIDSLCLKDPIACGIWEDSLQYPASERYTRVDQNVFLQPAQRVPIKVHNLGIYDETARQKIAGYLCLDILGNEFPLILIGRGDRTGLIEVNRVSES